MMHNMINIMCGFDVEHFIAVGAILILFFN